SETRRSVIETEEVEPIVGKCELVEGEKERRIFGNRFIKQVHGLKKILPRATRECCNIEEELGAQVSIISRQIFGRLFRDGSLLYWRKPDLQLIGYFLCNLALDRE